MLRPQPSFLALFILTLNIGLAESGTSLRLPQGVHPVRYEAALDITPGTDTFSGRITIAIRLDQSTSEITLHAKEINFTSVTPPPREVRKGENDLVTLVYEKPVAAGKFNLSINYTGTISRVLTDGAFQQQHAGEWYVFTKFEPITARRVFPCFDEPGFKVPWTLSLTVPAELKAFSNTSIKRETAAADGKKLVEFRETKPLPSYLIAFAAGPFDVVETAPAGRNHIPSRIVVPKGRAAEAAYAASITPKMIELLEGYFGRPYPYEKLDQVVVPLTTAWGAMENAGMIAYGDFFLAPQSQDSELRHQRLAGTMEHEMAHQWFGDLVTMQWWNDLWLNEAFASWISDKLVAGWHPEWGIPERRAGSTAVFRADSLTTARNIRQPIEAAGDIGGAFDGITYGKGQAVIAMFEHYLGGQAFQQGVRDYLKAHAFENATSDDLLSALDHVAPKSKVGEAFGTFLNQVGFPLVSVEVDCGPKPQVNLKQERMLAKGAGITSKPIWKVPVCLSLDGGPQCVLLESETQSFALPAASQGGCPASIFADSGAAGYYAVQYSTAGSSTQMASKLNRSEKASLLRNVDLLLASGVGDPLREIKTAATFSQDSDANLVRQSATVLESLSSLVPGELRGAYGARIRELYQKRALELRWRPEPEDSSEVRALRSELTPLVAEEGEDAQLAAEARKLADAWLVDRGTLEAESVAAVLFAAAWNGNSALFQAMEAALHKTPVQRERTWIIAGMAGFRDPEIAKTALALIGAPGLDARETSALLFTANAQTRETVWEFTQQNFDRLNNMLPSARGVPFASRLPDAAVHFCNSSRAESVDAFFKPRLEKLPGGAKNLARAVERIELCAAQAEGARPAVAAFLRP